nr:stage V sporulation protein AA [Clostridiisalibacter paucivorans]
MRVFVQLENKISKKPYGIIKLKDIANIYCIDEKLMEELLNIQITTVKDQKNQVISVIEVIKCIDKTSKNLDIVVFGSPEILVNIKENNYKNPTAEYIKVVAVSFLLFIGAAIAIINFHEDVNMEGAFDQIYLIVTGEKVKGENLLMEIPYSIGLSIGMLSFFNHIMKKRYKKEPSPLEIETFMYKKNIDDYVLENAKQNNSS